MQRRVPTQERGKRRVEAILDAAAEVFAEVGFEAATIDQIAERAESSVGSVYQFFGSKDDLFEAIATGCLERSGALFETFAGEDLLASGWEAVMERLLDAYFEWERTDAHVRALYTNLHLYTQYEEADQAMMNRLVDGTAALLQVFAPKLKPAKRKLVAATVVNTVTAFLFVGRRAPEREAKRMLAETKVLLIRYLRPYVEE